MPTTAIKAKLAKLEALARAPGTKGEGEAAKAAIERLFDQFPQLRPDPLIGLLLLLDRTSDQTGGCCDKTATIQPGAGPHRYGLRCARCNRHRGWLKRRAADILRSLHADGRLSARPILRDHSIAPGK